MGLFRALLSFVKAFEPFVEFGSGFSALPAFVAGLTDGQANSLAEGALCLLVLNLELSKPFLVFELQFQKDLDAAIECFLPFFEIVQPFVGVHVTMLTNRIPSNGKAHITIDW